MPLNALAVTCINARYRYWGRHILRPMKLWCSSTHSLAEPEAGTKITTRRTCPAPGWGLRESRAIAASDTLRLLCLGGWAALRRASGTDRSAKCRLRRLYALRSRIALTKRLIRKRLAWFTHQDLIALPGGGALA